MTGLLNPKPSEIRPIYFSMILIVYLGHAGFFHPVCNSFLFFLLNQFLGEALSCKIEET